MEKLFENILEDDEKIVKTFKPNKAKLYASTFFSVILCCFFPLLVSILGILIPDEFGYKPDALFVLIPISLFILVLILTWVFLSIYYKNVYYAYSNKRIIIRSGILGVDYKSLDLSMIGAVDVYVSVIDKILRKNTGSVTYGSMASPMNGNTGSLYRFSHIETPYETCKEIKTAINSFKESKKQNN